MKNLIFVALILMTGCTSAYHTGVNIHNNDVSFIGPIAKEISKKPDLIAFEEECISAIISGNVTKIQDLSNPRLLDVIRFQPLRKQFETFIADMHLNGSFARREIQKSTVYMDEIIGRDPYKIYTFIICEYELMGPPGGRAVLLIEKKTDCFKLWGFAIFSCGCEKCPPALTYTAEEVKNRETYIKSFCNS